MMMLVAIQSPSIGGRQVTAACGGSGGGLRLLLLLMLLVLSCCVELRHRCAPAPAGANASDAAVPVSPSCQSTTVIGDESAAAAQATSPAAVRLLSPSLSLTSTTPSMVSSSPSSASSFISTPAGTVPAVAAATADGDATRRTARVAPPWRHLAAGKHAEL